MENFTHKLNSNNNEMRQSLENAEKEIRIIKEKQPNE
jgi:hypothetical protein